MSKRPSRSTSPRSSSGRSGRSAEGRAAANGYWMYGLHAVEAALRNSDRHLHELLVTSEGLSALESKQAPIRISPNLVERQRLDLLCERDAVHQASACA